MSSKVTEYIILASVLGLVATGYFYNKSSEEEIVEAPVQNECTAASFPLDPAVQNYIDTEVAKINAADAGVTLSGLMTKVLDFEKVIDEYKVILEKNRSRRNQREANQAKEKKARESVQERLARQRATEAARLKDAIFRSCGNLPAAPSPMQNAQARSMRGMRGKGMNKSMKNKSMNSKSMRNQKRNN